MLAQGARAQGAGGRRVAPGITLQSSASRHRKVSRRPTRSLRWAASSTSGDIAAAVATWRIAGAVTGTTLIVDGGQHLLPLPPM
jgi:hypothetical protein